MLIQHGILFKIDRIDRLRKMLKHILCQAFLVLEQQQQHGKFMRLFILKFDAMSPSKLSVKIFSEWFYFNFSLEKNEAKIKSTKRHDHLLFTSQSIGLISKQQIKRGPLIEDSEKKMNTKDFFFDMQTLL
ncbi:hypothetical protein BpHYR1_010174 [Brachionus plicatilis]|uniref:Uncharacterized protein n=1 Tax=Brachionus plicatilis TaxID=10195 RepID=A0A3M7PEU1_BRAPC|nr:hypothetical protein BpHYR1_010174 [Brachionus plicatilis]